MRLEDAPTRDEGRGRVQQAAAALQDLIVTGLLAR
jgi:hypothetical protein